MVTCTAPGQHQGTQHSSLDWRGIRLAIDRRLLGEGESVFFKGMSSASQACSCEWSHTQEYHGTKNKGGQVFGEAVQAGGGGSGRSWCEERGMRMSKKHCMKFSKN